MEGMEGNQPPLYMFCCQGHQQCDQSAQTTNQTCTTFKPYIRGPGFSGFPHSLPSLQITLSSPSPSALIMDVDPWKQAVSSPPLVPLTSDWLIYLLTQWKADNKRKSLFGSCSERKERDEKKKRTTKRPVSFFCCPIFDPMAYFPSLVLNLHSQGSHKETGPSTGLSEGIFILILMLFDWSDGLFPSLSLLLGLPPASTMIGWSPW